MIFLIAEDSPRMRASIKSFLCTRIPGEHLIHEASDGAEAIALFERVHPDWVLMDIVMEPMDGLVATQRIVAAHPEAKIIVVTNFADERYRRAAIEARARAFVPKENLHEILDLIVQAEHPARGCEGGGADHKHG